MNKSAPLNLCADASRAAGEDPIGSAPHWQEVTVLELDIAQWAKLRDPAGWSKAQAQVFEGLRGKVERSGAGFGLLMSAPQRSGCPLRLRHYTLNAAQAGYTRRDYASSLPQSEWARGLHDTLLEPQRLRGPSSEWQEQPAPVGADFHVCTHGTVDAACGKYGVPVFGALNGKGGVRAWRTGHFGGHRFAATAIELPTGLAWAHLDPELALRIARREVPPATAYPHLRGYLGLSPLAQVLDRELFLQCGWQWLTTPRWATVTGEQVTLHYRAQGLPGSVSAAVTVKQVISVPGSSHKSELSEVRQYQVQWL